MTGNEQLDIENEIIIKWYNLGKTVENRCFQKDSKSYKIKKQYFKLISGHKKFIKR